MSRHEEMIARLNARVAELERDLSLAHMACELAEEELAALKANQPSGAVLPERQSRKKAFECGGVAQEQFVTGWNACLDEVERLNRK